MNVATLLFLLWSTAAPAADAPAPTPLPVALQSLVEQAAARGLPSEALALKAREGLSKGVPEARVAEVMRELVTAYARAQALLPGATPESVRAAGEALRAGVGEAALLRVAAANGSGAALTDLGDLVRLGVPEVEAARLVAAASQRGPDFVGSIAAATATLVARGATPEQAARLVQATVSQGRPPLTAVPVEARDALDGAALHAPARALPPVSTAPAVGQTHLLDLRGALFGGLR